MKNILYVFLISMLPIIELRGAIPIGAALGVPFYLNYPAAVFGNLLPVPFILLFIPRILDGDISLPQTLRMLTQLNLCSF